MSLAPSGPSAQKQPVRLDEDNEVICLSVCPATPDEHGEPASRSHINTVTEMLAPARARVISID